MNIHIIYKFRYIICFIDFILLVWTRKLISVYFSICFLSGVYDNLAKLSTYWGKLIIENKFLLFFAHKIWFISYVQRILKKLFNEFRLSISYINSKQNNWIVIFLMFIVSTNTLVSQTWPLYRELITSYRVSIGGSSWYYILVAAKIIRRKIPENATILSLLPKESLQPLDNIKL